MRVVFMGTPDIAVPTLAALIGGKHTVVGVFCQPDKEKGRGKKMQMPPTKEMALDHHIPVFQPVSLKGEDTQTIIDELKPDVVVVIAYGKILPAWLLQKPKYGCINLHASLLPKYRGAAPIQYAILHEEQETGMTIMQMDEGLDTGDILCTETISIDPLETSGSLFGRLGDLGGQMINDVLDRLEEGSLVRKPQNHDEAILTQKITKEMGRINWSEPAHLIGAKIRAFNPAPGCFSFLQGKRIKFCLAQVKEGEPFKESCSYPREGTVIHVDDDTFTIFTGQGSLNILEVQPENKKKMSAGDFMRGHQIKVGTYFGE